MTQRTFNRILIVAGIILLCVILLTVAGCVAEQAAVTAPDASFESVDEERFVFGPDGKMVLNDDGTPRTAHVRTVKAKGAGVGAVGEGVKAIKAGNPPTAGPDGASGGKGAIKWFDIGSPQADPVWLIVSGALMIVVGAVVGYYLGWQFGAMLAGAGACLLAVAWYPWLLLIIAALGISFVLYLLYEYVNKVYEAKTATAAAETATADADAKATALGVVVKAVETAGGKAEDVKNAVTDEVKSTLAKLADISTTIEAAKL